MRDRDAACGGLLRDVDVAGRFLTGLNDEDYESSARGSLRALADKKLLTPQAGGFHKALAEIAYEVVVARSDCGNDSDHRSPMTCQDPLRLCQRCVGEDPATDQPFPVGTRIGLLAASLIGERSTQLSMKAMHGGASGTGVEGDLTDLRGLFGHGRDSCLGNLKDVFTDVATYPHGRPSTHGDIASEHDRPDPQPSDALEAGRIVAGRFTEIMGDAVSPVYCLVILRQLWDTMWKADLKGTTLTSAAERHGKDAITRATARGSISELIEMIRTAGNEGEPGESRIRLVVGGVA